MKCSPVFCVFFLPIIIIPITSYGEVLTRRSASACRLDRTKPKFEYEYYQKGDVMIGGLFSAHLLSEFHPKVKEVKIGSGGSKHFYLCNDIDLEEYKSILAMIVGVNQINQFPEFLPNITLGYHIFNTCNDPKKTLGYAVKILSVGKEAPNYYCKGRGEVAAFIGDSSFHTNQALAQLLSLHRYTQVTYRVVDTPLSDGKMYPTLFRMTPDDRVRYAAIFKLLHHFGWNYVGILSSDDGSGDKESQELSKLMSQHGICTSYIISLTRNIDQYIDKMRTIMKSTAEVVIVCGPYTEKFFWLGYNLPFALRKIKLIFPPSWSKIIHLYKDDVSVINCSFVFSWSPKFNLGNNIHTHSMFPKRMYDPMLEDIWIFYYYCFSPNLLKNDVVKKLFKYPLKHCPNLTDVSNVLSGYTPIPSYAYMAVYILAKALHDMYMKKNKSEQNGFQHILHKYVRNVRFLPRVEILFNQKKEIPTVLNLQSWLFLDSSRFLSTTISTLQGPDFVPKSFPNMSDPRFWKTGKVRNDLMFSVYIVG
ncbi:taste receptor type 1 member 3-like [Rana temporaria]|uniref:taste receptor type 1 member 3-like n=1 Tax=Rana temporaria TaxID=8407 RepID=UPI001AAD3C20|nr:taste receptor type 1 member 3-like [Rana temporaria]